MDFRSHTFLVSQVHSAGTNGGGDLVVGIAVVVGAWLVLFAMVWLLPGADDDSGPGRGGGGGGPRRPDRPPGGPSWWPDFEREFARYAAGCAAARRRSRDLVGAVDRDRAVVPAGDR